MRVLKFDTSKQKIFFASDFHLSHKQEFIWKPRGFTSFAEHSKAVIDGINAKVGQNDILFYLGDFSLNSTPEETKGYFREIKCRNIIYLWGNHESNTIAIYKEALGIKGHFGVAVYPFKWENVTFLGDYALVSINNQLIVLSHFAHLAWDNMQHGAWNLCGHCHGNAPLINPECKNAKVLDIGVDNALKMTGNPCFSFEEAKVIVDEKIFVPLDHHDKNTS